MISTLRSSHINLRSLSHRSFARIMPLRAIVSASGMQRDLPARTRRESKQTHALAHNAKVIRARATGRAINCFVLLFGSSPREPLEEELFPLQANSAARSGCRSCSAAFEVTNANQISPTPKWMLFLTIFYRPTTPTSFYCYLPKPSAVCSMKLTQHLNKVAWLHHCAHTHDHLSNRATKHHLQPPVDCSGSQSLHPPEQTRANLELPLVCSLKGQANKLAW